MDHFRFLSPELEQSIPLGVVQMQEEYKNIVRDVIPICAFWVVCGIMVEDSNSARRCERGDGDFHPTDQSHFGTNVVGLRT